MYRKEGHEMKEKIILIILLLFFSILSFTRYIEYWSGDALIHLRYVEVCSKGNWFEYNTDEKSLGTTSIGYTFFLTILFKIFDLQNLLLFQKIFSFIIILIIPILIFWKVQEKTENIWLGYISCLFLIFNPGYAYNIVLGMEQPFACLLVTLLILFDLNGILQGILLGIACILRPECFLLFLPLYFKNNFKNFLHIILIAFLIIILSNYFAFLKTGIVVSSSAHARIMQAKQNSYQVGFVNVDMKPFGRMLAYLPLFLALFFVDKTISLFPFACLLLYTFVTGCAHFGRYSILFFPLLTYSFGIAFNKRWIVILISFLFLTEIYVVETNLRKLTIKSFGYKIEEIVNGYNNRKLYTEKMYGNTKQKIACVEVQWKWFLDDNIQIVSMDGRTFPKDTPNLFNQDGTLNTYDFLKYFQPDLMIEKFQNNNSFNRYFEEPEGQKIFYKDIKMERIHDGIKFDWRKENGK